MAYLILREKALNLIAETIGISKSTLHYWLARVPYVPNREVIRRIGHARARAGQVKHEMKLATLENAKQRAVSDVGTLSRRDLFFLGIGLSIGEGEKTGNICIVNADPRIILLAIRWFKEICGATTENFTLAIHLYPDNNRAACLQFWSETTGIPVPQFGKPRLIDGRASG